MPRPRSLTDMEKADAAARKSVLIVAYHFPPQAGSSGFLRTLKFVRYLPENGWDPIVLTVRASAYERVDFGEMTKVPPQVPVVGNACLDTKRHISIAGVYPGSLCRIAGSRGCCRGSLREFA